MTRTLKLHGMALGLILAVGASPAWADDVSCADLTVTVANAETAVAVSLTPQNLIAQCSSASGAALYLVTPSEGVSLALEPSSEATVTFRVQNAEGEQATAQVRIQRN